MSATRRAVVPGLCRSRLPISVRSVPVDSYKWLPRSIAAYYRAMQVPREEPVPWTPLTKPLGACRVAAVTTAGVYMRSAEAPFDTEREQREPLWGDPTYRSIPRTARQADIGACHLHINNEDLLEQAQ